MKAITPQQAIDWLKKQHPASKFSFYNIKHCGCLFTSMIFGGGPNKPCICRGGVRSDTHELLVPFHDKFWNEVFLRHNKESVTRKQAISILESMTLCARA